jgi:rare lipoprotein A
LWGGGTMATGEKTSSDCCLSSRPTYLPFRPLIGRYSLLVTILYAVFLASCAGHAPPPKGVTTPGRATQRPYRVNGVWYYPIPSAEGYVEEGVASWYGREFDGKPTSCGEPYDMYALTAAHKTLPLGTHVKVTNLQNGRSEILRVNDRGPFVAGRIIDLSCRAAQDLGVNGLARVKVEAVQVATEQHIGSNTYWQVEPVPSFRYGAFTVQIGSFKEQGNAYRLKAKMSKVYHDTQVALFDNRGENFYRVQVGAYKDILAAQQELERLRHNGFEDAFVVAMEGR